MILQIPSWLQFLWDQFNLFLVWFAGLDLAAQILTGCLILLGLIGVIQIIKGAVWIAKESVKASLLITFIILYLMFAGFKMAIVAIVDIKRADAEWKQVVENIKWLVDRFYPVKKKHLKHKKPIVVVEQPEPVQPPQVYVIKERDKAQIEEEKPKAEYCHNCGSSMSMKMFEMLHQKGFAFCEQCGAKYTAE